MGSAKYQNDGDSRTSGPGFGLTTHPDALFQPYGWSAPRVVFVNSMSDLFHARVPIDFVASVFAVIADTPQHTYQVLTKRSTRLRKIASRLEWPSNLWMGVSVEDSSALYRVDDLRSVPAAVRFLSCEPLIGPLDGLRLDDIGWVIAGGESGPGHRPLNVSWVTAIRDSCIDVACRSFSSSGVAARLKKAAAIWTAAAGIRCQPWPADVETIVRTDVLSQPSCRQDPADRRVRET
jgi:protein gp37